VNIFEPCNLFVGYSKDCMDESIERLFLEADEIYCFLFAGWSFLKKYYTYIEEALKFGKIIHLLIAKPGSSFISDTLEIEKYYGFPISGKNNNINDEITEVEKNVSILNANNSNNKISLKYFQKLYRLPFILGVKRNENEIVSLISITNVVIPPGRTKDSLLIKATANEDEIKKCIDSIKNNTSLDVSNLAINLFVFFEYIWNNSEISHEEHL